MIKETLIKILKKYVNFFINEYSIFLSMEQLDTLKNIDYEHIFDFKHTNNPFGEVLLNKIVLCDVNNDLINSFLALPEFNSKKEILNNKNLSSYLKYMCDNGYQIDDYYRDILMYFVFRMVIPISNGFINGLINQEVRYLSIKYSFKCANLYAREEAIITRISRILNIDNCRKILFMDKVTRFKYLSENIGYRYAIMIDNVEALIEEEYKKLEYQHCDNTSNLLDYIEMYDKLLYGNVYDYIIDFSLENKIVN